MLYLLGTGRPTLTKLLGLSDSQPDKPPEGQLIFWFCDAFFFSFFLDHNEKHAWRISLVCRPYLSAPSLLLPPFILTYCLSLSLSLSVSPVSLFPSSQRKSSYLNWPQEPLLSDFNAPYSVDSISITPVTKD